MTVELLAVKRVVESRIGRVWDRDRVDRVAKEWETELSRDIRHTCKIVPRKVYGRFLPSQ